MSYARSREPARRRARRLERSERRGQLLACALRVFARRGLGAARHAEIAAEAGVAVSTAFVYFPTREALVGAVLDEVERFYLVMAERIHAQDLPAPRVLLEHARAFAASVTSQPDHARVWLDWSTAIRDGVWPRYLEFQDRMLAILERTVRRGQVTGEIAPDLDAGDEARLLVGSAHMIAQMQFTGLAPERVDAFVRALVRAVSSSR